MVSLRRRIVPALIFAAVDFVLTLFLTARGTEWATFWGEEAGLPYNLTLLDFVLVSWLRCALLFGVIVGIWRGHYSSAAHRLRRFDWVFQLMSIIILTYGIAKMLLYQESRRLNTWFWLLFAWSSLASILHLAVHRFFSRLPPLSGEVPYSAVNGTPDDIPEKLRSKNKKDKEEVDVALSEGRQLFLRLLKFSKPDWHILLTASIFLLVASVCEILIPYYISNVISGIIRNGNARNGTTDSDPPSIFNNDMKMMLIFSVGSIGAAGFRGGLFTYAVARFTFRIRRDLFRQILAQDISFFDATRTGSIMSRLVADTSAMSDTFSVNINIFIRNFVRGIGVCVFMFAMNWRLSFVTLGSMPLIGFVSYVYGNYYEKLQELVQEALAFANEVAEEVISSMKTVYSFANEKTECERYRVRLKTVLDLMTKEAIAYSGNIWTTQTFDLVLLFATLFYGGHLVVTNQMSADSLLTFIIYQMSLGECLDQLSGVYGGLMQAIGASKKVFEYIDKTPGTPRTGIISTDNLDGKIEFKDVEFTYKTRADYKVLNSISFTVEPGKTVALVGHSGCGKSSCIGLLEHFYNPSSGSIEIDGVSVEQYDHVGLHSKMALVGQEPVLFPGTVAENIAYGLGRVPSDAELERVAVDSNSWGFVSALPQGLRTECGEKGMQLSAGQKQRIALARALIREPRILLLDEATSALDTESELIVQQALEKNMTGRTVLLIAHRLSTVEKADLIIVLDKGTLVEKGSHAELLRLGGVYSKLVKRQLTDVDAAVVDSANVVLKTSPQTDIPLRTHSSSSAGSPGSPAVKGVKYVR